MITMTKLGRYGQLGNQLFQYALLRAVAMRNNFEMKIPKNYNAPKKDGLVELEPYNIQAATLLPTDKISNKFNDDLFHYNPAVFDQPDGTDFQGWFQTEKYFRDIEERIRFEFQFSIGVSSVARDYINTARATATGPLVSLHVRRGDYLDNPDKFRILPLDYYRKAIDALELSNIQLMIFSDDTAWCREHFQDYPTALYALPGTHWLDMCMMSMCDHHIIGPSSFSWWGAWLNPSTTKRVTAPTPWFGPAMGLPEQDIVPESWLKIDC